MLKYFISLLLLKDNIDKNTPLKTIQVLLKSKFEKEYQISEIQNALLDIETDLIEEPEIITYPDDFIDGI